MSEKWDKWRVKRVPTCSAYSCQLASVQHSQGVSEQPLLTLLIVIPLPIPNTAPINTNTSKIQCMYLSHESDPNHANTLVAKHLLVSGSSWLWPKAEKRKNGQGIPKWCKLIRVYGQATRRETSYLDCPHKTLPWSAPLWRLAEHHPAPVTTG